MSHKGGLLVKEGLQLSQQLNQPVEGDRFVSQTQSGLPIQQIEPHGCWSSTPDVWRSRCQPSPAGCLVVIITSRTSERKECQPPLGPARYRRGICLLNSAERGRESIGIGRVSDFFSYHPMQLPNADNSLAAGVLRRTRTIQTRQACQGWGVEIAGHCVLHSVAAPGSVCFFRSAGTIVVDQSRFFPNQVPQKLHYSPPTKPKLK